MNARDFRPGNKFFLVLLLNWLEWWLGWDTDMKVLNKLDKNQNYKESLKFGELGHPHTILVKFCKQLDIQAECTCFSYWMVALTKLAKFPIKTFQSFSHLCFGFFKKETNQNERLTYFRYQNAPILSKHRICLQFLSMIMSYPSSLSNSQTASLNELVFVSLLKTLLAQLPNGHQD